MTHPCLHYEINEAWLLAGKDLRDDASGDSAAGSMTPAAGVEQTLALESKTAEGGRIAWSAVTGGVNGYALDGTFEAYFADNTTVQYAAPSPQ